MSHQEHTRAIEKLACIVYAKLPKAHQLEMAKQRFFSSLKNLSLQKYLLGVPIPTMKAAVRAGNDYPQQTAMHRKASPIR